MSPLLLMYEKTPQNEVCAVTRRLEALLLHVHYEIGADFGDEGLYSRARRSDATGDSAREPFSEGTVGISISP